jgi:hypothetical protein
MPSRLVDQKDTGFDTDHPYVTGHVPSGHEGEDLPHTAMCGLPEIGPFFVEDSRTGSMPHLVVGEALAAIGGDKAEED